MAKLNNKERRDSFRVEMPAMTSLKIANPSVVDPSECFPELHAMALLSETDLVESELNRLNDRIKDLAVRKTVDLLRQQMSLLAKLIDIQTIHKNNLVTQKIDISEGGCCLETAETFEIGDRLAVALIFTPSYFTLFTITTVTSVTRKDNLNKIHLTFMGLTEIKRQQLMKQMFKAQTELAKIE